MQLPDLLKAGAVVVDVRSRGEFASGARKGSLNIPLHEFARSLKKLDRNKPVVLCCASGARSAQAEQLLRQEGFTQVVNVGAWTNIPG
jgi:phage shock protein E